MIWLLVVVDAAIMQGNIALFVINIVIFIIDAHITQAKAYLMKNIARFMLWSARRLRKISV